MKHVKRVAPWAVPIAIAVAVVLVIYLIDRSAPDSLYLGGYVKSPTPEIAARPSIIPIWLWLIPGRLGALLGAFFALLGIAAAAFFAFKRQADLQRTAFAEQARLQREAFDTQAEMARDGENRSTRAIANALSAEFELNGVMAALASQKLAARDQDQLDMALRAMSSEVYRANLGQIGLLEPNLARQIVMAVRGIQTSRDYPEAGGMIELRAASVENMARSMLRASWELRAFARNDPADNDEKDRWVLAKMMDVEEGNPQA